MTRVGVGVRRSPNARALRALGAAVGLVSLVSCGGGGQTPTTTSAAPAVSGTVLDAATRLGVAQARAEVTDGPQAGRSVMSDGEGRFRLDGMQPGGFTLRVSHPEFKSDARSVTLGTAGLSLDIQLRPRPCEAPSCGPPSPCNRVLAFLRKPFEGEWRMNNQFDHRYPLGFGGEDGLFVNRCGVHASYDGHNGYDWGMPVGTPILTAAAGTVTFAGAESRFFCPFLGRETAGNWVTVEHGAPNGERFFTQYGHLEVLSVSLGQRVDAGAVIGASGNTGCSAGPHLHFTVRRRGDLGQGVPTDPYGWQGAGEDPWALHPQGVYSAWLWAEAPALGAAGPGIFELHSPNVARLGVNP